MIWLKVLILGSSFNIDPKCGYNKIKNIIRTCQEVNNDEPKCFNTLMFWRNFYTECGLMLSHTKLMLQYNNVQRIYIQDGL